MVVVLGGGGGCYNCGGSGYFVCECFEGGGDRWEGGWGGGWGRGWGGGCGGRGWCDRDEDEYW